MKMSFTQISSFLYHWFGNVGLSILRLKKRDENLWLFGSWRGEKYNDNPRYLFEYVCKNCPNIQAVWITKTPAVKERLLQEGKCCYLSHEKTAKKLRLHAGFYFFTHGYHDFGDFDLCAGAVRVALGHGMPVKRAYFATNFFREKNKKPLRLIQYLVMKIHNKAQQDIAIASSESTKNWLMENYEIKASQIVITGQPRNDVLFNQKVITEIKKQLEHKEDERFVLYAPTWRDTGEYGGFSSGEASFLSDIVDSLKKDTAFNERLKKEKIMFYIKPHPNRTLHTEGQGNIRILHHDLHLDTQELLATADILMTDYSSIYTDFALTDRPIHFYVPDLEEYEKGYNGLFLTFEELASFWFKDLERFKQAVFDEERYHLSGLDNARKINTIYDDKRLKRGQYCAYVVEAIRALSC